MKFRYFPTDKMADEGEYTGVEEACMKSGSIEQLIVTWVGDERCLSLGQVSDYAKPTLSIAFGEGEENLTCTFMSLSELLVSYGAYEKLNEQTYQYCDIEGSTPDLEWFEVRNQRLGVQFDETLETHVAPAHAVIELVLSYAFSSAGFVRIAAADKEHFELGELADDFLQLSLVFFGEEPEKGWCEEMLFSRSELQQFVNCVSPGIVNC